ncbi:MAG: nitrile hydratase subunit beta [Microbacteriaceae bacterium]|nr:nitrile hydratase subunit beta [Burkholderiaceae bacterium]
MTYRSHADLGGQAGFGAVQPEPEGELWHEAFEPRVLALTLAMGATGAWNIDQSRAARETQPDYPRLSYYRLWLAALQQLMAERGQVLADELAASQQLHPPVPVKRVLAAADVPAALARGSATERPASSMARFQPGDRVRTHTQIADHHTRLPAYARGKRGLVERVHGCHVFADANAQGLGEQPQWLYSVVFDSAELWGAGAQPGLRVAIDAWEPYLESEPAAEADLATDTAADTATGARP